MYSCGSTAPLRCSWNLRPSAVAASSGPSLPTLCRWCLGPPCSLLLRRLAPRCVSNSSPRSARRTRTWNAERPICSLFLRGSPRQKPSGIADSFEEWLLKRHGISRRIAVSSYSLATLPSLVVGTEYVATVHARIARRLCGAGLLEIRTAPVRFDRMEESMQWRKLHADDPGLAWLRGLPVEASKHIEGV